MSGLSKRTHQCSPYDGHASEVERVFRQMRELRQLRVLRQGYCRLRDQIVSNLERAWEITGGSEDELAGVMTQISQAIASRLKRGG
jgi:hypothetical protein